VKDQGQRKQITSAYYAFANGDPETFAVQFAVLLRAHATSLKLLPSRLEKALAAETHKMSALVIAHQNAIGRMASLIDQARGNDGVGEGTDTYAAIQQALEERLAAHANLLRSEREKIVFAVDANGRAADRIVLALILSYMAGILSVLALQHLLPFLT
jgi:hypothetical protein